MKARNISDKKIEIIQWISAIHDEKLIDELMEIRSSRVPDYPNLSDNEIIKQARVAEEDIKFNRTVSQSEVKKRFGIDD